DGDGDPWTVERLRAAREAHLVEHGGCASTPRHGMSATPTSSPPRTEPPGAYSRCSWTPRDSTTGWRSWRSTSPARAKPGSRCSGSCAWGAWCEAAPVGETDRRDVHRRPG